MNSIPLLDPIQIVPLLDGLSLGLILVMVSIGLTLIFGFLGVINFAHGGFYMLGAYVAFSIANAVGNFWIALAGVLLAFVVGGAVIERVLLRPTYELDAITQLLITVGIALGIEGGVILVWGENPKNVSAPAVLSGQINAFGITYPSYRLFLILIGVLFIVLTWAFLEYTNVGLVVRASLTDETMARALGNDIAVTYTLVFAGAIALTAVSGALMAPLRGVNPETGASILLEAFIVVVMGGLGSFRGSVVAGLLVGFTDVLVGRYISFRLSGFVIFALLVVVLLVRPSGIFGKEGVMEE